MVYSHKRQCSPTSVGLTLAHPNNVFPEKYIEHLYFHTSSGLLLVLGPWSSAC